MSLQNVKSFSMVGLWTFACLALLACHKTSFVKRTSSDPNKQARLDWNYKTTVAAYQNSTFRNYKWNGPAIRALEEFACFRANVLETNEPGAEIISTNATAAVDAGCNDPMIRYLFVRFSMDQTNSAQAFTIAFCQAARDIQNTTYPPVRKFYSAARALDQIIYTYGTNTANRPVWREMTPLLAHSVEPALSDKTMPAREAYEIANEALYLMSGDTNQYHQAFQCVEKLMLQN